MDTEASSSTSETQNFSTSTDHRTDRHRALENAIINCHTKNIENIIKKGEKLCPNCLYLSTIKCNLDVLKCMVIMDPSILKPCGLEPTLLMHYSKNENQIKFLLQQGANPCDRDSYGKTVLMHALQNNASMKCIQILLNSGADASVRDNLENVSVLHVAANFNKYCTVEMFDLLIKAGADPLAETISTRSTVISVVLKKYFECNKKKVNMTNEKLQKAHEVRKEKIYQLIRYLFNLPQFQDDNFVFNCQPHMHPQYLIFQNWLWFISDPTKFDFIFEKSNFINKNLVVNVNIESEFVCKYIRRGNVSIKPRNLVGPVGSFFNCDPKYDQFEETPRMKLKKVKNFLEKLVSHGFSLADPFECFSPLTLFLFSYNNYSSHITPMLSAPNFKFGTTIPAQHEQIKDRKFQICKMLVDHGVNVGQNIMNYHGSDETLDDHCFEKFAQDIKLPDAIFAALAFGKENLLILRLLLPYLAFPPLSLLFCNPPKANDCFAMLFPILSEFGPLSPGSILNDLKFHFDMVCTVPYHQISTRLVYHSFMNTHKNPPSLQVLCRNQIRRLIGASGRGNLPELVDTIDLPSVKDDLPSAKDLLKVTPFKPLNFVLCEHEIIAQEAEYAMNLGSLHGRATLDELKSHYLDKYMPSSDSD